MLALLKIHSILLKTFIEGLKKKNTLYFPVVFFQLLVFLLQLTTGSFLFSAKVYLTAGDVL